MPLPSRSLEATHTIGKLCASGDEACARGDYDALRALALQLEAYAPEPCHCALGELVAACISEPTRVTLLWDRVKDGLYREAAP